MFSFLLRFLTDRENPQSLTMELTWGDCIGQSPTKPYFAEKRYTVFGTNCSPRL